MKRINTRRVSPAKSTVSKAMIREGNKKNKNRTKVSQPFISEKKSKNFKG